MRLSGIDIPDNKKLNIALSYVYGVGRSSAKILISESKVDGDKKAKDLTSEEIGRIQAVLEKNFKIEGELRQVVKQNIQRLKEIQSYRGSRHQKGLPLNGQRTRRNTRTVRGNIRKTVGSGRRKVELK